MDRFTSVAFRRRPLAAPIGCRQRRPILKAFESSGRLKTGRYRADDDVGEVWEPFSR